MFYVWMGFGAVWLLVTLYLVYLGLRQRRVEEELRSIQEQIASRKQ